ncbi:MAG: hypothetical protein AAFS02_04240 [Pseudomonadota bacterium]
MNALFINVLATMLAAVSVSVSGSDSLDDQIQAAMSDAEIPFRLEVSCANAQSRRSLTVYRGSVAVFNRTQQVLISTTDRQQMLSLLNDAGFSAFEARYGEKKKADKEEAPLRVSCRVHLAIAGHEKTAVQLFDGAPSPELLGLAAALLDVAEAHADAGVQIADLEDGLEKLSEGVLAPEMLTLRLVRLPKDQSNGFIMRIEGGELSRQSYAPGERIGDAIVLRLNACVGEATVRALRDAAVWNLPRNLQRDGTTGFDVSVLGHEKSILARSTYKSGSDAEQTRFERLMAQLEGLPAGCLQ